MNTLLEVPTKIERRPRVVPRRRGETTPTTIEVPRLPELPIQHIPVVPSLPEPVVEPPVAPVFQAVLTPLEAAVRQSLASEHVERQYQSLANAVCPPGATRRRTSVVLLAPESREQTTSAIARLATVLAERGPARTLLVDGDTSQQRLSRGFQLDGKPGLCEILSGLSAGRDEIVRAASERLDILPCGTAGPIGKDAKDSLRNWLDRLRGDYRHVLVDGGSPEQPLGALLAQTCDAVYLVVEVNKTESAAARKAVALLRHLDASVLGCIVVG